MKGALPDWLRASLFGLARRRERLCYNEARFLPACAKESKERCLL
ncbi:MAG: hypothetical protein OHK0015_53180 [Chloroflexi bacterium OHK40]